MNFVAQITEQSQHSGGRDEEGIGQNQISDLYKPLRGKGSPESFLKDVAFSDDSCQEDFCSHRWGTMGTVIIDTLLMDESTTLLGGIVVNEINFVKITKATIDLISVTPTPWCLFKHKKGIQGVPKELIILYKTVIAIADCLPWYSHIFFILKQNSSQIRLFLLNDPVKWWEIAGAAENQPINRRNCR